MGKWTRRGFISAGVIAGGGLIVGVAIRPGNRAGDFASYAKGDDETLLHTWVKLDSNNVVTAIVPHSEMGQGVGTALAQMLADELDADWNLVKFEEAPAISAFANYPMGKAMLMGGVEMPDFVVPTVDGVIIRTAQALDLQITGGSLSVRTTGAYGMRVAGAAVKEMLRIAAAEAWQVPVDQVVARDSQLIHEATGQSEPYSTLTHWLRSLSVP